MEEGNRKSTDIFTPDPSDAGKDNKMASPSITLKRIKPVEHELKIMEVEGAVITEPPETIELDDDVDVEGTTMADELETLLVANNDAEKADPLQERIFAKVEVISDVESTGSYKGHDPMGLLERIDSTHEVEIEDDDDDIEDETDNEEGSTSNRISRAERWQIWMKRWPWLLHEHSDGDFAFCLYCNVVINVNKKLKYIKQHNLSLYHQERENNYVAFKNSEKEKSNTEGPVKHEFGTNEYVAAMKKERKDEVEVLNNFNWERWLKWHSWLERIQPTGTIGLCKCCNVRMNVEFVYLRKRHEASKGHCEALRQIEKTSRKRKRSSSPESIAEPPKKLAEETTVVTVTVVDTGEASPDPSDFCELLPDTNPQQCRCTICNCRMAITSFMRHLKTKVHCANLLNQNEDSTHKVDRGIWAQYAEKHPWLVADPNDPTLAYCHVCCRRFMYGHSEIKRRNHEQSEKHQAAVAAAANAEEEELASEDKQMDQSEPEQSEQDASEQEQSEEQSECVDSDDDYIQEDDKLSTSNATDDKQTKDPPVTRKANKLVAKVQHYSWLRYSKDRKIQLCKYCRVRFHNESSKVRHDQSAHHKKMLLQFKERRATHNKSPEQEQEEDRDGEEEEEEQRNEDAAAADSEDSEPAAERKTKTTNKTTAPAKAKTSLQVPPSMHGKVLIWKDRFPWLSYKRSEQRPNYGWCKLCEASVFIPSFKYASKHQRSSRHVRLRHERKHTGTQSLATATAAALATGEAKHKAAMAELQAKYSWLEPDATDENHCHCKICDSRLPIKVFYLRQHDGSRKHAEHLERLQNSSEATTETAPVVNFPPQTHAEPRTEALPQVQMDVDQDSDEALSVKSELSALDQSTKQSRRSLDTRRILRAVRDSMGKRQLDMATDMIHSSFDIVRRLRTLQNEMQDSPLTPMQNQGVAIAAPLQPRDTIDLFLDSISQTMKSLPADLVAEGKAKIMQLVCNLELRGMQRTASTSTIPTPDPAEQLKEASEISSPIQDSCKEVPENVDDIVIADSSDSESSSTSIDQMLISNNNNNGSNSNSNTTSNLSEVTLTAKQRSTSQVNNSSPQATNTAATPATLHNGSSQEVPVNIRRILPSTVQIGSIPSDPLEQLRVVPIKKLTATTQSPSSNARNSMSATNSTKTDMNRSGQSQQQVSSSSKSNSSCMATPPSSNSSSLSDLSNGTTNSNILRKIRVSNGSASKIITLHTPQQSTQQLTHQQQVNKQQQQHLQQHHQQQQQQLHQQQKRYGVSNQNMQMGQSQGLNQIQIQAQAQLRALNANRPVVVRRVPANRPSHP